MAFAKQMDKSRAFNSGRFLFRLHVQHVHYSITLKSTAMKNLLLCCLAATLAVSSCQKTSIRQTLEKAGENRRELETVLEHYKNEPLKEKAARFLLENMDGHFAHTGEAVDVYDNYMDSVFRHCNGDRVFWIMKYDTILQRTGLDLELSQDERLYDAQSVTADFLTEHIDSAFTVWQQNWNKQYSFEMFCRYVLPYRESGMKRQVFGGRHSPCFMGARSIRPQPRQLHLCLWHGQRHSGRHAFRHLLSSAIPSRPPPHGTRTCQVGFLQGICTPVRGRTKGARTACHHRLHTTVGQPELGA